MRPEVTQLGDSSDISRDEKLKKTRLYDRKVSVDSV